MTFVETLDNLAGGFAALADPTLIAVAIGGVLLGTLVGVLPGIGPIGAMALLLGFTAELGPTASLVLFAGIYFGAVYGGSTTSILINVPGEAASVVTAIDGYEMTKKGRSGAAMAIAAFSSFAAGTVAVIGLTLFAPWFSDFAVKLGPPEYMALSLCGLLLLAALANGSTAKAVVMIWAGLLVATVGADPLTGSLRFDFGSMSLAQGFPFIALVMGVFGVAEALTLVFDKEAPTKVRAPRLRELVPSKEEARASAPAAARGGLLGFVLGMVPGPAPVLSTFASYVLEKRIAKDPSAFGKGAPQGVAGPEAANNAAVTAAFMPLMVLGIPFAPTMAMVLAALLLNGIVPGPTFINDEPEMFWTLIASMYFGNILLLALSLPMAGFFTRFLSVPPEAMVPVIISLCVVGVYAESHSMFSVFVMLVAGVLGFVLRRSAFPMSVFVLAVVLQPTLETSLRQTLSFSDGDPTYLLGRPVAIALLALAVLVVIFSIRGARRLSADEVVAVRSAGD